MKRTSFKTKARKKFPMPDNPTRALEARARDLVKRIFNKLQCPVCAELGEPNDKTVPHHILNKGMYDHLRFIIWNLVPLCLYHHGWAHGDDRDEFFKWMQDYLPRHYRFWLNEKDKKQPVRQSLSGLQDIIDDLKYYEDHPLAVENLIYEKE